MAINIGFNPAASAIAGPALIGGQGQYAQWANQYLNDQYKFGANLQFQQQNAVMDRLTALNQMANQNQMQQQQQAFQMQMAPVQSQLDMQQQAFQSDLGNQSHQQQQILGAQLGSSQSRQDFSEQQQRDATQTEQQMRLQQAHVQQQQSGMLANQQAMATFNEDQQAMMQFRNDPLATYKQNFQQAAQGDMARYSDDQQMQMGKAKENLTRIQSEIAAGRIMAPSAMADIKSNMATLNQISSNPANAPEPTPTERFQKTFVWQDPADPSHVKQGSESPGEGWIPWQQDKKTGEWDVPRNYVQMKKLEMTPGKTDEGPLVDAKVAGQNFKNENARRDALLHRAAWITKELGSRTKDAFLDEPQKAILRNQIGAEYDQSVGTGTAQSVPAPQGQPQVTGASPAGQPAAAAPSDEHGPPYWPDEKGPQVTPQQPQGQPAQSQPASLSPQGPPQVQEATQIIQRLKKIPMNKWSAEDRARAKQARMIVEQFQGAQQQSI